MGAPRIRKENVNYFNAISLIVAETMWVLTNEVLLTNRCSPCAKIAFRQHMSMKLISCLLAEWINKII